MLKAIVLSGLILTLLVIGCRPVSIEEKTQYSVLFDDFNYIDSSDSTLTGFGWEIREGSGGPGVKGATWKSDLAAFENDPNLSGNKWLSLRASTKGKARNTFQAEISHKLPVLEGTYAALIYFTDSPDTGPDGDRINQTFFAISPLAFDMEPDYSELDFAEYLPNGGWGETKNTLWMTSWETYQNSPWIQDSESMTISQSFEGWHLISATVAKGEIHYYIDGIRQTTHGGNFYPEQGMYISFNTWFLDGGLIESQTFRSYKQRVDWVYFTESVTEDHQNLSSIIASLRKQGISRRNDF